MLGMEELKESIEITQTTVECPVKGCSEKVERQRKRFKREERFKCPKHNIYISPATFEYPCESDNILWKEKDDLDLFSRIKTVKRESRIVRDRSEDAVTWNVFRFLERNNLIESTLSSIIGSTVESSEVIYWSYSQSQQWAWDELLNARVEFGEASNLEDAISKGSEPDLIVKSDDILFFIEAKLTADNKTPSKKEDAEEKAKNPQKYITGGNNWFEKVFKSGYKTIVLEQKYELLRFWLIGTWIATRLDLDFYLVNLVLSEREKDIEAIFKRRLRENQRMKFIRITWEDIYQQILDSGLSGIDKDTMIKYFRNKTIGYDGNGKLQKAFSIL